MHESVLPGDQLELWLYWVANRANHGDYRVVVHWSQGRNVLYREEFSMPAQEWQEGAPLIGRHRLSVPEAAAPGRYRLHLLLYDRQKGDLAVPHLGAIPWMGRSLPIGTVTVEQQPTPRP